MGLKLKDDGFGAYWIELNGQVIDYGYRSLREAEDSFLMCQKVWNTAILTSMEENNHLLKRVLEKMS